MPDSQSPQVAEFLAERQKNRAREEKQAQEAAELQVRHDAVKKVIAESTEPEFNRIVSSLEAWAKESNGHLEPTEPHITFNSVDQNKLTRFFSYKAATCTLQLLYLKDGTIPAVKLVFEGPLVNTKVQTAELLAGVTGTQNAFVWKTNQQVFGDSAHVANKVWDFLVKNNKFPTIM